MCGSTANSMCRRAGKDRGTFTRDETADLPYGTMKFQDSTTFSPRCTIRRDSARDVLPNSRRRNSLKTFFPRGFRTALCRVRFPGGRPRSKWERLSRKTVKSMSRVSGAAVYHGSTTMSAKGTFMRLNSKCAGKLALRWRSFIGAARRTIYPFRLRSCLRRLKATKIHGAGSGRWRACRKARRICLSAPVLSRSRASGRASGISVITDSAARTPACRSLRRSGLKAKVFPKSSCNAASGGSARRFRFRLSTPPRAAGWRLPLRPQRLKT